MQKTTTTKNKGKGARLVIISVILAALVLVPIVGLAAGRDNGVQPAIPFNTASSEGARPKSSHMLEWGVFGIALGEFAGILGMGISKSRTKRSAAKKQELVSSRQAPVKQQAPVRKGRPAA